MKDTKRDKVEAWQTAWKETPRTLRMKSTTSSDRRRKEKQKVRKASIQDSMRLARLNLEVTLWPLRTEPLRGGE